MRPIVRCHVMEQADSTDISGLQPRLDLGGENLLHGPLSNRDKCHCNKYLVGMTQMIDENHASVQIISDLDNSAYDSLLTKNVVFLLNWWMPQLSIRLSSVLFRWTPILVNRLPAVEEYLGADYPLYYSSYEEALEFLNNQSKLLQGYLYLRPIGYFHVFHMKHFY